ncbi:MAG: HD-GYP domain-containing protein [Lachnospiraceae bacterium]|nr:HD-GYP domain-containing protein [Lachnospiraceae bacterium]
MNKIERRNNIILIIFAVVFVVILVVLIQRVVSVNAYNSTKHSASFTGDELFTVEPNRNLPVSVNAVARTSTWTKLFDLNNEGLTEHNYQAYTYDFFINNNTPDEIREYSVKITFADTVFLLSAWNGGLEIHQNDAEGGKNTFVPDLRQLGDERDSLNTVSFDGEELIRMNPGDYFYYIPSTDMNAIEIPIKPNEGVTPGIIMYLPIGDDINNTVFDISYTFHRNLSSDTIYRVALFSLVVWVVAMISHIVTSFEIKKYKERHERDNERIQESIETFTGFIDAKDPYTNGHSSRVADYTRLIAKKLGYEGEELDRIYYVALLHDCGKIGVPDSILGKPGKLTDEEFEVIKSHTVRGCDILTHFKSLTGVEEGAHYHHERYDGNGYPEGKAGEDIPLIARMICVADSFDAMNSNRCYRKKLTKENIIEEIEKNKGKQFDPKIADVFLELIKDGKIKVGE